MKQLIILLLFFTTSISGEELKCRYFGIYTSYMCEMLNIFNHTQEITSVSGEHVRGKGIPDVETYFTKRDSLTKYIPTKVCSIFKNLKFMQINGYNLVDIKKNVFAGCPNLQQIAIESVNFKELDEDLLSEAPTIERFSLSYSKVETLKANFFKNNQIIKYIVLRSNNLKIIEAEFPASVISISVMNNLCANGFYSVSTSNITLAKFVERLYEKCSNKSEVVTETEFIPYETFKGRYIDEAIKNQRDKILQLEELFNANMTKLHNRATMSYIDSLIGRSSIAIELGTMQRRRGLIEKTFDHYSEIFVRVTKEIEKEMDYFENELDRKQLELEDINLEMFGKVNNIHIGIVILMSIQILIACAFAVYVYLNVKKVS